MLHRIEIRKDGKGFTLIELMVVLAIVAVLATILISVIVQVKQRVHSSICLNHLRQWGLATQLYALDHEDWLPKDGSPNGVSRTSGWYVDLPRMLDLPDYHQMTWRTNKARPPSKSLWICPANRNRSNGNNLFHYCLNAHVNGSGTGNQIKLSSIPKSASTIWLFDNGKKAAVAQHNNVHTNLHEGGAQFTFLDGHSARFHNSEYWDFSKNQGKLGNPELIWKPFH